MAGGSNSGNRRNDKIRVELHPAGGSRRQETGDRRQETGDRERD